MVDEPTPKKKRGFALLSPDRLRELSSYGGRRAQRLGTAHQWTVEEAKAAYLKGKVVRDANRQRRRHDHEPE